MVHVLTIASYVHECFCLGILNVASRPDRPGFISFYLSKCSFGGDPAFLARGHGFDSVIVI